MRQDIYKPIIMIPFHPDYFRISFWVGELTNVGKKVPVLFFQAGKIQVGEDIAVQDQAPITGLLQQAECLARPAHVRAEVQVRQDQRVVDMRVHGVDYLRTMLRGDESGKDDAAMGNQAVTCR